MSGEIKVVTHGFRELEVALTKIVIEVDPVLSKALRALAEPVKKEAQASARSWAEGGPGQSKTAAGIRIRRRKLDIRVEQGASKTTGQHPNYGGVQMRHFFEPALQSHQTEIGAGAEKVIGELVDI
jgi:hypothetical protein